MKLVRMINLLGDVHKKYGNIDVVDKYLEDIVAIQLGHIDTVYNEFITPSQLENLINEQNANPNEFSALVAVLE